MVRVVVSRDAVKPAALSTVTRLVDDVRDRRAGRRVIRGGGVVRAADADRPRRRPRLSGAGRQQLDVLACSSPSACRTRSRSAAFGSRAIATVGVNAPAGDLRDVDDVAERERGVVGRARRPSTAKSEATAEASVEDVATVNGVSARAVERERPDVVDVDRAAERERVRRRGAGCDALPPGVMLAVAEKSSWPVSLAREVDDRALRDGVEVVARQRARRGSTPRSTSTSRRSR